jgi:hypothetical protein
LFYLVEFAGNSVVEELVSASFNALTPAMPLDDVTLNIRIASFSKKMASSAQ